MARAVHTAVLRQKGPWLVRREQLKKLDEILWRSGEYGSQNASARDPARKLQISLTDGKKLLATSFGEALSSYPSLERGLAVGFKYTATVGAVSSVVWLEKNQTPATSAPSPDTDHQLVVEVTPEDLPGAQELFYALVEWTESVQLPRWERNFERRGGWLCLPALYALFNKVLPSTPSSGDYYKAQARELLSSGADSIEQAKAVQLLLSIASDAPLPANLSTGVNLGPDYYRWLLLAIYCSLATLYVMTSPTTLVGLGRGEARITLWAQARKAILYTLPVWALTWLGLPLWLRALGLE